MFSPTISWPSTPIPQATKDLLDLFCTLVDTRDPNNGKELAEKIFSKDAEFVHPNKTYVGSAEIADSRQNAWKGIASRRHVVTRVYTCNEAADDLLMTGVVTIGLENGKKVEPGFCARCIVVEGVDGTGPRVNFWQGWGDTAVLQAAIG